jgi:hypothetical protein
MDGKQVNKATTTASGSMEKTMLARNGHLPLERETLDLHKRIVIFQSRSSIN